MSAARLAGTVRGAPLPVGSMRRQVMMYVGERCSIVMCPASAAIAGISVTAVAPLPITTTRLPA